MELGAIAEMYLRDFSSSHGAERIEWYSRLIEVMDRVAHIPTKEREIVKILKEYRKVRILRD